MRRLRAIAIAVALGAGSIVAAQTSPILTIDQDRLFAETDLGARSAA